MEVEAEKHKNLGNAAFGDRNYEAAVHAYSAGLRCLQSLKSTSARDLRASLLHNRSLCYTQLKDQESALRDAQHALLCRPTWTKALYRLAEVKQNSGDVEGAITTLKSLLKLVTEDAKRKRALEKRLKKLQIQFELQRKQEESGGAASAAPRLQPDGKTPAARTANDEGMGVDEEAEPEEEVEEVLVDLGFVEEGLEAGWRIWDQGKCGGKPEFLMPLDTPKQCTICEHCGLPMLFLCQVYAPIEQQPSAFHRVLYVYACRDGACCRKQPGGKGAVAVLRLQLPRRNPFYPYSIGASTDTEGDDEGQHEESEPDNGTQHLPEFQLYVEQEPSLAEANTESGDAPALPTALAAQTANAPIRSSADNNDDDELMNDLTSQADLDSALGHTFHRDAQVRKFQQRLRRSPEQCLRYCLWRNDAVLWANSAALPPPSAEPREDSEAAKELPTPNSGTASKFALPPCPHCGAPRAFEMQLLPQLLYFMDVESSGFLDFDWDTIVVFSCSASCDVRGGQNGVNLLQRDEAQSPSEWHAALEFAWVQTTTQAK